jgi:hypothetical protein
MLVTHYAIPLAADELDAVRQRIAAIGPDFDTLPGLQAKLFLLATDTPSYALYYLWQNPDALHDFLHGPKFVALVARFGRPELVHYLTRATTLPFVPGQRVDSERVEDAAGCVEDEVVLEELRAGGKVRLRSSVHGRFEVVYVAGPNNRKTAQP